MVQVLPAALEGRAANVAHDAAVGGMQFDQSSTATVVVYAEGVAFVVVAVLGHGGVYLVVVVESCGDDGCDTFNWGDGKY